MSPELSKPIDSVEPGLIRRFLARFVGALRAKEAGPVWVDDPRSDDTLSVQHLNGVSWEEAPLPPEKHDCAPQTRLIQWELLSGSKIAQGLGECCACGGRCQSTPKAREYEEQGTLPKVWLNINSRIVEKEPTAR